MKTNTGLPVMPALVLALCCPSCSLVPAESAGDRPYANARQATAIVLDYWTFCGRSHKANVTGGQMERLAEIISRLQPYPHRAHDIGADIDPACEVVIDMVVDGKCRSVSYHSISTKAKAGKYRTGYTLDEADYAELTSILHALAPIGFFGD